MTALEIKLGTWSQENSVSIVGSDTIPVFTSEPWTGNSGETSGNNNENFVFRLCLTEGTYMVTLYDSYGDGWNGHHYVKVTHQESVLILEFSPASDGAEISAPFTINTE